jgi:hypothetical protein
MKQTILTLLCIAAITLFYGCDESLDPQENYFGLAGEITINAYVWQGDSVQIDLNGENMAVNNQTVLTRSIETAYEFVNYYGRDNEPKNFTVLDNKTLEVLQSYSYSFNNHEGSPVDTFSFFYKSPGIWLDDVLSYQPGTLSQPDYTGYRFIFPNMNAYSNSGYTGTLDAIVKRYPTNQLIDTLENIGTATFSDFIEFPYASPPLIRVELVKHGTGESYLPGGTAVMVDMAIQSGKSMLFVLEETADENGNYAGVWATIDLTAYFDY